MRRGRAWAAALALLVLGAAPVVSADCWDCGPSLCCEAARQGSMGATLCLDSQFCGLTCFCYSCLERGSFCAGTEPEDCDNPYDACEEHQSLRSVPNGAPIELDLLRDPPAAVLAPGRVAPQGTSCG